MTKRHGNRSLFLVLEKGTKSGHLMVTVYSRSNKKVDSYEVKMDEPSLAYHSLLILIGMIAK